jgi:hypothetical protein
LSRLPWDIAQDEFGGKGTDFIGILGTVLLRGAQSQFKAYLADSSGLSDTLPSASVRSQIRPIAQSGLEEVSGSLDILNRSDARLGT